MATITRVGDHYVLHEFSKLEGSFSIGTMQNNIPVISQRNLPYTITSFLVKCSDGVVSDPHSVEILDRFCLDGEWMYDSFTNSYVLMRSPEFNRQHDRTEETSFEFRLTL